jgi:hypothetical protein
MVAENITTVAGNRRASRRLPPKGQVRVECRKGAYGLGKNIAVQVLDLSETGVRLIVNTPLAKNNDVEVTFGGASYMAPIKRVGRVVWTVPTEKELQAVGVNFSPPLDYPSFLRLGASASQMR